MNDNIVIDGELYHYGIKGMKWGIRRFQDKNGRLTAAGKTRYAVETPKKITVNKDGSKNIPSGFIFNRVGKDSLDVNQSGALYVSYGKADAARYIKSLGPTPVGKLLGTAGEAVQHITVKENMRMASDSDTAIETARLLSSNGKLLDSFNKSIYSTVVTGDWDKPVTSTEIDAALNDPSGKAGQKLAYGVNTILGDPNYVNEAKTIYAHFRERGYDALPDLHDRLSGTASTATIIINPDKVEVTSVTTITKDVMKAGKDYVKTLEQLKPSDLIDSR